MVTITNKEQLYFSITKESFEKESEIYEKQHRWEINVGTITTPFKFRFSPSVFTNNLSLGASINLKWKLKNEFYLGAVGGLSLSSVQLDKNSTNGYITQNTDRPAFTPSLHAMFGYKKINALIGIGWDIINKNSDIEKSWIYNGKPWLGLGIGVSLFSPTSENKVKANDGQE